MLRVISVLYIFHSYLQTGLLRSRVGRAGCRRRFSETDVEEHLPVYLQLHHVPRVFIRILDSRLPDVRPRTESVRRVA